jgi:hypothetical protein
MVTTRFFRLWTAFACLTTASTLLAQKPGFLAFQDTLAWNRYGSAYQLNGVVDNTGNTYVVSDVPNTTIGGLDFYITAYDVSGNGLLSKKLFNDPSSDISIDHIILSPPVAGKQYIYFETLAEIAGKLYVDVAKVGTDGTLGWMKKLGDASHEAADINVGADAAGFAYVAIENFSSFQTELIEYDANGMLLNDSFTPTMLPTDGKFVNGRWFLNGRNPASSTGNVKWGYYNATSGAELGTAHIDAVNNGINTYTYQATDYVDNNGAIYLGVTVNVYADSNPSTAIATNHFIRCYASTGVQAWASKSYAGQFMFLTGAGSGGPIWAQIAGSGSSFSVENYDLSGNQTLSKSGFSGQSDIAPQSDTTGEYLFWRGPTTQQNLTVQRIDLGGNPLYTNVFAPPAGPVPPGGINNQQSQFTGAQSVNGVLHTFCIMTTSTDKSVVQRYVSGITLASVTGAATMTSNTNYTAKVQLNGPAPTGGILVKLSSNNAKLLFANNTTASSVAIPAGSIYANVVLHSATVLAATKVLVAGNQNGVIRQVTVTVNP